MTSRFLELLLAAILDEARLGGGEQAKSEQARLLTIML